MEFPVVRDLAALFMHDGSTVFYLFLQETMPSFTKSRQQARDEESRRMDLLMEISRQLNTGLDADALAAIVDLLQAGVSTEKIVAIVTELQRANEK